MAESVKVSIQGNSGDAQQAWLQMIGLVQQAEQQMRRLANVSEKQTRSLNQSMQRNASVIDRGISSVKSYISTWMGMRAVGAMLNMVSNEIRDIDERQKAIGSRRLSFEQGVAMIHQYQPKPAAGESRMTPGQIEAMLRTSGAPVQMDTLASIAYEAVSSGRGSVRGRIQTAIDVAKAFPEFSNDPDTLKSIVGSMGRLKSIMPDVQTRDMLGMINAAASESRVTSPEGFARYIVPAAVGMKETGGFSLQESFAMLAMISNIAQDDSGQVTSTFGPKFAAAMKETARSRGISATGMELLRTIQSTPELRGRFLGALEEGGAIGGVGSMTDAELMERFLADPKSAKVRLPGRSLPRLAAIGLLQAPGIMEGPGSPKALLSESLGAIPATIAESRARFEALAAERRSDPMLSTLYMSQFMDAGISRGGVEPLAGLAGKSRQKIQELRPELGIGFTDRQIAWASDLLNIQGDSQREILEGLFQQLVYARHQSMMGNQQTSFVQPYTTYAQFSSLDPRARAEAEMGYKGGMVQGAVEEERWAVATNAILEAAAQLRALNDGPMQVENVTPVEPGSTGAKGLESQ